MLDAVTTNRIHSSAHSFQRETGDPVAAPRRMELFSPLLLIAVMSFILLVAIYGKLSAQHKADEIRHYGQSTSALLAQLQAQRLEDAIAIRDASALAGHLHTHPQFQYLLVENRHGQRLLTEQVSAVPELPLTVNQRHDSGMREFASTNPGERIMEFYTPLRDSSDRIIRIGFSKPKLHFPLSPSFYALLSLPLILLTFAALARVIRLYRPMQHLATHCRQLQRSHELNHLEDKDLSPQVLHSFNELIDSMKQTLSERADHQDSLQLDKQLLHFDKLRSEAILNGLPYGIAAVDSSGSITFCNQRLQRFINATAPLSVGQTFSQIVSSGELGRYIQQHLHNPQRSVESLQLEFCSEHGNQRVASVTALPLASATESRNHLGSVFVFHDISDVLHSKRASEEFVIHTAHELKTPLHVLKMYSELMMDSGDHTDQLLDSVNTIYDEVDRMSELVNNLLNIARLEMGDISADRQRIKLADFLGDIVDTTRRNASQRNITVEQQIPDNLSPLHADKNLLRIAINNLLSNAVKYSPDGSRICFEAMESDDHITITVTDEGPGIAAEDIDRIFDKFFRSEDPGIRRCNGHGLGLPLARDIVQLHHGCLRASSTRGQGSQFSITFNKKFNIVE